MKTSGKLAFVSAVAIVAVVVTAPAQASKTCYTAVSNADGPPQYVTCQDSVAGAVVANQTWSNFYNQGTGLSWTRFLGGSGQYALSTLVDCFIGGVFTFQGSPNQPDVFMYCAL